MQVPGHLSRGSCSEWDAGVAALVAPSLQRGKWWPKAHSVAYICNDIYKINDNIMFIVI